MASGYAGTLVFDVQQGAPEQSSKRRRQEYSYDKWKYRVQNDNDQASSLKRQRSNNVKKVKERERRTKMAESVQSLRDIIPGANSRKSNQIIVMNSAVEYIKKLEEAVKFLQYESDVLRQVLSQRGLPLPQGISSNRFQLHFEAASIMDESDSDNDDRDARRQDDDDSTPSMILTSASSHAVSAPHSQSSSASLPIPVASSFGSAPDAYYSSSPGTSTPIPIPGTVGAPIRPHETRTRLERVTGSSQHLVNKNPRKLSPTRELFLVKREESPADLHDRGHEEDDPIGAKNQPSDDMMETMDFMNDIEEVGTEWPLYSNQHHHVNSSGQSFTGHGKLSSDSPILLGKFDSPSTNAKSVGTFSPKLVFVDSPTNLLAGASYAAYVNPFDTNY